MHKINILLISQSDLPIESDALCCDYDFLDLRNYG